MPSSQSVIPDLLPYVLVAVSLLFLMSESLPSFLVWSLNAFNPIYTFPLLAAEQNHCMACCVGDFSTNSDF